MKVSTENDNNLGYEKITIMVDNMPLIEVTTWTGLTVLLFCYVHLHCISDISFIKSINCQ